MGDTADAWSGLRHGGCERGRTDDEGARRVAASEAASNNNDDETTLRHSKPTSHSLAALAPSRTSYLCPHWLTDPLTEREETTYGTTSGIVRGRGGVGAVWWLPGVGARQRPRPHAADGCVAKPAPTLAPTRARALVTLWLPLAAPTGWNSWNLYGCNINESLIANTAQAMVSSGLYKFGYTYVVRLVVLACSSGLALTHSLARSLSRWRP